MTFTLLFWVCIFIKFIQISYQYIIIIWYGFGFNNHICAFLDNSTMWMQKQNLSRLYNNKYVVVFVWISDACHIKLSIDAYIIIEIHCQGPYCNIMQFVYNHK